MKTIEQMDADRFTLKFKSFDGEWVDLMPGFTGDYEWAQKGLAHDWIRDGHRLTADEIRIYKVEVK